MSRWNWNTSIILPFNRRTLWRYQCWKQREADFFLCLLFMLSLFFLFQPGGVLVCSQHLGQGLGIVWLYLKTQREVCGPAPLNPDRLSFAWCGCQVDALASLPRMDEIIMHLKKHVFLNFRQDNSCQMCDWCRPSLCQKVPHLIAVWIIKLL